MARSVEANASNVRSRGGYAVVDSALVIDRLAALEDVCRAFGMVDQSDRVAQRLRDARAPLMLMVVGEGNFGKSTLINALVGHKVAPVSRLPKTWKVDVYHTSETSQAALRWRSRPDIPELVSIEEAVALCEAEEAKASSGSVGLEDWMSDLFQVDWHHPLAWPGSGCSLVDTPGFAQLRAETGVVTKTLFGVDGIDYESSDGFEYYYYRSDVVLWCIKATKLNDQDTLEAFRNVAGLRKTVVGVITHMDRVERSRWDEVLAEASRLYGEFCQVFFPVAAGGPDELRDETVTALRNYCEDEFARCSSERKAGSVQDFLRDESDQLVRELDTVFAALTENYRRHEARSRDASKIGVKPHQDAERRLNDLVRRTRDEAEEKLKRLWEACGGSTKQFCAAVQSQYFGSMDLERQYRQIVERCVAETQVELGLFFDGLNWERVHVGTHAAHAVDHKMDSMALGAIQPVRVDRVYIDFSYLLRGGVGGAMTRFGEWWNDGAQSRQLALEAVHTVLKNSPPKVKNTLQKAKTAGADASKSGLKKSYAAAGGLSAAGLRKVASEYDLALNRVGSRSSRFKSTLVPWPMQAEVGVEGSNAEPWSCYWLEWAKVAGEGQVRSKWSNALQAEYRAAAIRSVRRSLVKHRMTDEVRWRQHRDDLAHAILPSARTLVESWVGQDSELAMLVPYADLIQNQRGILDALLSPLLDASEDVAVTTSEVRQYDSLGASVDVTAAVSSAKRSYDSAVACAGDIKAPVAAVRPDALGDACERAATDFLGLVVSRLGNLVEHESLLDAPSCAAIKQALGFGDEHLPYACVGGLDYSHIVAPRPDRDAVQAWDQGVERLAACVVERNLRRSALSVDGLLNPVRIASLAADISEDLAEEMRRQGVEHAVSGRGFTFEVDAANCLRTVNAEARVLALLPSELEPVFDAEDWRRLLALRYSDPEKGPCDRMDADYRTWYSSFVHLPTGRFVLALPNVRKFGAYITAEFLSGVVGGTAGLADCTHWRPDPAPLISALPIEPAPSEVPGMYDGLGGFVMQVRSARLSLLGGRVLKGRGHVNGQVADDLILIGLDGVVQCSLKGRPNAKPLPKDDKQVDRARQRHPQVAVSELKSTSMVRTHVRHADGWWKVPRLSGGEILCSSDWAACFSSALAEEGQ